MSRLDERSWLSFLPLLPFLLPAGSCAGGMATPAVGPGLDDQTLQRARRAAGPEIDERFSEYVRQHPDQEYRDVLTELDIKPAPNPGLPFDPTQVAYFKDIDDKFSLSAKQWEQFRRTGLLVLPGPSESSMGSVYLETFRRDLPVLITSDSILHAWHRSFDGILMELEERVFAREIEKVLDETHHALAKHGTLSGSLMRESLADVDLYLTVALRLLAGKRSAAKSILGHDAEADQLFDAVEGLAMNQTIPLFGEPRTVDFSQFKPRGHYTRTPLLQRYFRAMMWLGRIDLGFKLETDRGLRDSALLTLLLVRSDQMKRLTALDRAIQFLVGVSDNLGPAQVAQGLVDGGLREPQSLADPGQLAALKARLHKAGPTGQVIRSQALPGGCSLPDTFQVFGQRFILDSYVLSKLVYDSILYRGEPVKRMMPTGLDVMAALGNNEAVVLLEPEIEEWHYATNLMAARSALQAQPPEAWTVSAYNLWLSAMARLQDEPAGNLPAVMRGQPWRRKQLQTQLGSWAELRHDTILYAKQSYSGILCEYPAGYVEPYPELFARMTLLAEQVRRWIEATGWSTEKISKYLKGFAEITGRLEALAKKELAGRSFDRDEIKFIKETIQVGYEGGGCAPTPIYTGWYKRLFYDDVPNEYDALVADVHTNPQGGTVLEVATGAVDFLVAAIDNGADRMAYVGPIYSYYEFPSSTRLTDREWQEKIRIGDLPERPAWTQPLLGPGAP